MLKNLVPETCISFLHLKFDADSASFWYQKLSNMTDKKYDTQIQTVPAENTIKQSNHTILVMYMQVSCANRAALYSLQDTCIRKKLEQESVTRTQKTGASFWYWFLVLDS